MPQIGTCVSLSSPQDSTRVEAFREAFGYTFKDPNLLKEALRTEWHPPFNIINDDHFTLFFILQLVGLMERDIHYLK